MVKKNDPWFVVVERCLVESKPNTKKKWKWTELPPYAVGPYANDDDARIDMDEDECSIPYGLLTIDAKNEGYVADECYMTQTPPEDAIMITLPTKEEVNVTKG